MPAPRFLLTLLLSFALLWPQWSPLAQAQTPQPVYQATTEADYWIETSHAMVGSAIGNGAVLLGFGVIELLPLFLASAEEPAADWTSSAGPLLLLLLVLPIVSTTLALEVFYQKPPGITSNFWWTLAGSTLSVAMHAALMIGLGFLLGQPDLGQTILLLLPVGFITGVVFEGMSTAWVFDQSRSFSLRSANNGGLMLVRHFAF